MRHIFLFGSLLLVISGCAPESKLWTAQPPDGEAQDINQALQQQLILANDGDTITLEPGVFSFSRSLIMEGKNDILIQGAGIDQTILTFAAQEEGAEGMRISNGRNITLADFTIQDAKGDNIKINDVDGLNLLNIKSEWTGTPDKDNGAYALYPVMCKNVLIDGNIAIGASDAGIYVGQSERVIVRNSKAYNNVAGIEIENTIDADVYNNEARDNTGGILVFDLPGLSQLGRKVRVFNNVVADNNYINFAPPGNIVGAVPPGTGVMVLASKEVEIFDNEITDNQTAGVALISYEFVEATSDVDGQEGGEELSMENNLQRYKTDQAYDPYPSAISVRDNRIANRHTWPTFENDIGYLLTYKFWFDRPQILHDGIMDPKLVDGNGQLTGNKRICITSNGTDAANLDAANEFANLAINPPAYDCSLPPITPTDLTQKMVADE